MKGCVVFVCVVLLAFSDSSKAPFVTPCRRDDMACLKASAQRALPVLAAGVPEFGIATMDPMHMRQVKTTQAGLEMDFRNTTVMGLKHCKVLSLKRMGMRTFLDLKCSVNMIGDYTLGGHLLIMPIKGDGKYGIKIRDIVVKILFRVGEKEKDGEKYWVVNSWEYTSNVEKNVHFQFNNLFNGNKQLSEAVHSFANEHWQEIFKEVSPPIVKTIVAQILHEIRKLFDHVPVKDLVVE